MTTLNKVNKFYATLINLLEWARFLTEWSPGSSASGIKTK